MKSQEFPVTLEGNLGGAAAAFEDMPVQVSLKAGANTFAIIKNWGHVDVDYIEVKVPSNSAAVGNSLVAGSAFHVQVSENLVRITGAAAGQPFAVLDMQGRVLRSGRVPAASNLSVYLDRPGVYLVKVGSTVRTVKIMR